MEYEFSRDPVRGGYHAKFSLEHEVFSNWLTDEVGNDQQRIDNLFATVDQVRNRQATELTVQGAEYLLTLNEQDVVLQLNASCEGVGAANGHGLEEDISVNDDNFVAECGLDDFSIMLTSWRQFLDS